ncbi:MAG: type II toxin-antitoxin system VapC family toxin [Acidimicrobiales bacterium]|nr:type II toxin-antitoxin system VapC family toxin [Acidimicrobiales bacterium]
MAFYLDTSAALKLVVNERETNALSKWCGAPDRTLISSDLMRTELVRATRRAAPKQLGQARLLLESVTLLTLTTEICERAAELEPATLRTLDALHLASALAVGDGLEGIVTYDDRLAEAATALGVQVAAPGT